MTELSSTRRFFNDDVLAKGIGKIQLLSRSRSVWPLCLGSDGRLYELRIPEHPDNESKVGTLVNIDMLDLIKSSEPVLEGTLEEYLIVPTYHLFVSSFSPRAAEVLAQIPEELFCENGTVREDIVAFRTIHDYPQPNRSFGMKTYFWARTVFYRRKKG